MKPHYLPNPVTKNMFSRRQILKLFVGTTLLKAIPAAGSSNLTRFLSCRTDADHQHYATVFSADGETLWEVLLPARGHDIEVSPDGQFAIVLARRPGRYLWVLDISHYSVVQKINNASDRLFYGHGVFSADQAFVFTTENDFEAGQGVIGIYDASDQYKRIGELSSFGIGPHQLKLMPDHSTLVIANGGIHTHPDYPRTKLNLDTMQPNLVYVDSQSGTLKGKYILSDKRHQLSIRHIDVNADSQVVIAMQHKGAANEQPPLIALHKGEDELMLLKAPETIHRRMKNYCGSAAFTDDGRQFSISSPRGNLITHWQSDGEYIGHSEQGDVSGLVSVANRMWASDGQGNLIAYQNGKVVSGEIPFVGVHWDNHLTTDG